MAYTPDLASYGPSPASFPPGKAQQADPDQPRELGWPGQPPYPGVLRQPSFDGFSPAPGSQRSLHDEHPRVRGGGHAPRRRRHRIVCIALIASGTLTALIAAAAIAAAGTHRQNTSLAGADADRAPASAQPSASSVMSSQATSPPNCASQLSAWRSSDTESQLQAIGADLGNVSQAATSLGSDLQAGTDPSADESALQSAAALLQSDTQAAEDNLVPGCVPDAREAESAGLTDFN
jgi:hypothetical protein